MTRTQMERHGAGPASPRRATAFRPSPRGATTVARREHPPSPASVIRAAGLADLAALGDFFAGLSPQSRYLRFFAPVIPAPALLRRLSGGDATVDAVVAVCGGAIIGHAMAADQGAHGDRGPRYPDGRGSSGHPRPSQQPVVTEIGVVVKDDWQGQGVGSALVRALITRAQARGVTSMAMDVLHANRRVLAMVTGHWPAAEISRYPDRIVVMVRLPLRP